MDGTKVESSGQLRNLVAAAGVGRKVRLDVVRQGKKQEVEVTLAEMPTEPVARQDRVQSPPSKGAAGITVSELTPELRQRLSVPSSVKQGAVVVRVDRSSAAARAGLRPGDVILEVDRSAINGPAALEKHWQRAKGPVPLLVWRAGSTVYLVIERS